MENLEEIGMYEEVGIRSTRRQIAFRTIASPYKFFIGKDCKFKSDESGKGEIISPSSTTT
jgi:hypothetical protein